MSGCTGGITCSQVHASNLIFDCRFAAGNAGKVMLLHGFPFWSAYYMPLMRALAQQGYGSVACNQRGYSDRARPEGKDAYNYNHLKDDIFAVADAIGFDQFHLVAHDHGAVLGWWAVGAEQGKQRVLSYTALSVPHTDAFSAGLFGKDADAQQQIASQYFTMFTLPNSAKIHGYFWYLTLGLTSGFHSADDFQKALWWYNGAMDAGAMSMPPWMSASELWDMGSYAFWGLRNMFTEGGPSDGFAQRVPAGDINIPALYICGSQDSSILCNRPYALKTQQYCKGGYKYVEVDCGHDILKCSKSEETDKVIKAVVEHITNKP